MIQSGCIKVQGLSICALRKFIRDCLKDEYDIQLDGILEDSDEGEASGVTDQYDWYEGWEQNQYEFTISILHQGYRFVDTCRLYSSEDGSFRLSSERGVWGETTGCVSPRLSLVLLQKVLSENYGGMDKDIRYTSTPIYYGLSKLNELERIVTWKEHYEVPIIYVSCGAQAHRYQVDVEKLALYTAGIAHVVVESSPLIGLELKERCRGKNPYHGGVGIFYPSERRHILLASAYGSSREYFAAILKQIFISSQESWQNQSASILERRFGRQVDMEKHRSDETLELCSDLLDEKELEVARLKEQVAQLKSELYVAEAKLKAMHGWVHHQQESSDAGFSLSTTERDFYPGEQKDVVLRVLRKERDALLHDYRTGKSRKVHVLNAILEENQMTDEAEKIKKAFVNATKDGTISSMTWKDLERYGFSIDHNQASHYKIVYQQDDRYQIGMSATPSDRRAGENLATAFMNLLFGY